MKHVETIAFSGNVNIGLYVFATDTYAIAGHAITEDEKKKIEEILQVPVYVTSICGTAFAGLFLTGTDEYLLVPPILFEKELAVLESIGVPIVTVDTLNTALGNNVILTKNALVVNDQMEKKAIDHITKETGVKTVYEASVKNIDVIGSILVLNTKGGLAHPAMSEKTLQELEKTLKIPITTGTINQGSEFVKSGIICNSKGFLVGNASAGPEITNADEAFGFVNQH